MNKIKLLLLTILVFSCAANKNSYRIYLQNEKYELTDFEKKIEKSFPENLKDNVTFHFYSKVTDEVKLFIDGNEIPNETESLSQSNHKSFYFSAPKPKSKFLVTVNEKKYDIPIEYFNQYKHSYLVDGNIYLTKGASFAGANKFYYGKSILVK